MSRENKDIRMSTNFVRADKVSEGAVVAMGVDEKTLLDLVTNKYVCILFVVDWEQYQEIAKQD